MFDSIENRIRDTNVRQAIYKVPRDRFVLAEYLNMAYEDIPLAIGCGQTISQPSIVALMTELLELKFSDRVLEIGTGSGYQTAILAELVREVFTIEVIPELAENGRKTLETLGYRNIHFRMGDGHKGWLEQAPFDAIIAAAAAEEVPSALIAQLADQGRMVLPLGAPGQVQQLWKLKRQGEDIHTEPWGAVRFVPFVKV